MAHWHYAGKPEDRGTTRYWYPGLCVLLLCYPSVGGVMAVEYEHKSNQQQVSIALPEIKIATDRSLSQLLRQRRSVRE